MSQTWPLPRDIAMWQQARDMLHARLTKAQIEFDVYSWNYPLMCSFQIRTDPEKDVKVTVWPAPCTWGRQGEYYWGCFETKRSHPLVEPSVVGRRYPEPDSSDVEAVAANLEELMQGLQFVCSPDFDTEVRIEVTPPSM